jgi:hypothetical protein
MRDVRVGSVIWVEYDMLNEKSCIGENSIVLKGTTVHGCSTGDGGKEKWCIAGKFQILREGICEIFEVM